MLFSFVTHSKISLFEIFENSFDILQSVIYFYFQYVFYAHTLTYL